jgi:hypothetical protein
MLDITIYQTEPNQTVWCQICNQELTEYTKVLLIWKTYKPQDGYDIDDVCVNYKECMSKVLSGEKERGDWEPYAGSWDIYHDRPRYKLSVLDPDYICAWADDCECFRRDNYCECFEHLALKDGDDGKCRCN